VLWTNSGIVAYSQVRRAGALMGSDASAGVAEGTRRATGPGVGRLLGWRG
jgi:hypothetical protein